MANRLGCGEGETYEMDTGTVALVAAVAGSIATMVLQVIRDGQVNRRDVRSAACVIRSEIVRNQSTVQTVLAFGMAPPGPDVQIRIGRLEDGLDRLAIDLPRDDIALLLSFLQMSESAGERLEAAKVREGHSMTERELDWFANTWMPAADFCEVLLDLRGLRFWDALLHFRGWLAFRKRRSEVLREGFPAPQLDEFLAKMGHSSSDNR